jgi:hypothetical protein
MAVIVISNGGRAPAAAGGDVAVVIIGNGGHAPAAAGGDVAVVVIGNGGRAPAVAGVVAVVRGHLQLQVVMWPSSSLVMVVAHLQVQVLSPLLVDLQLL